MEANDDGAMSLAEGERLEPAVEALLRAESWRAPAPAPRATRATRGSCRARPAPAPGAVGMALC